MNAVQLLRSRLPFRDHPLLVATSRHSLEGIWNETDFDFRKIQRPSSLRRASSLSKTARS